VAFESALPLGFGLRIFEAALDRLKKLIGERSKRVITRRALGALVGERIDTAESSLPGVGGFVARFR
jgi:hypothetical protein